MFILDLVIPIIEDVLYYLDVSWILRGSAADDTLCNIKHFGIHRIECFYIIWNFEKGFRAASCKKSTRKNKLIRKNKSTRTEIFRYKISVLVDLFFLINLFFSYWLLHEVAPYVPVLEYFYQIPWKVNVVVSTYRLIFHLVWKNYIIYWDLYSKN